MTFWQAPLSDMIQDMHRNRIRLTVKSYAAFILILTLTDISCAKQNSSLENLSTHENYTMLHPDPGWVVTVSSTSAKTDKPRSEIHVYHFIEVKWKEVFAITVPETYNARAEIRRDMPYEGHPIAVIRFQRGAEAETLQVYAFINGTLRLIQTIDAGGFEWNYEKAGKFAGKVVLSAIHGGVVDPGTTYIWDGSKFAVFAPTKK